MGKAKVTLTIDETLVRELDESAAGSGGNRSRAVEEVLRAWRRQRLERELIEGYLAMADEDRETAESALAAGKEVLS